MALNICVNIASLVHLAPWLAPLGRVTPSPTALIKRARAIGFDSVQLVPLRGATGQEEGKFCENAWNPGSIMDFLAGRPGELGHRHLQDIVLFPGWLRCFGTRMHWELIGKIPLIRHGFSENAPVPQLVELHPGLDLGAEAIAEECRCRLCQIVVDTHHLQRGYRSDEIETKPERAGQPSPLGCCWYDWVQTLETLQPVLAPILHFHPTNASELLGYEEPISYRLLHKWLELTKCHEERWIVLEYAPTRSALLSRWASDNLATRILADVRFCIKTGKLPGSMSTLWQPGDI